MRLDQFISQDKNISRTEAQKLIQSNLIEINGKIINKNNYQVDENISIKYLSNDINQKQLDNKNLTNGLKPLKQKLDVVYEDKHLMIINKPSGIIVHPTSFQEENTLANIIKNYFIENKIKNEFNDFRNGIMHRLDKDTSGLLIVAKTKEVESLIKQMFIDNKIDRYYLAIILGSLESNKLEVQAPIKRIKDTNKREVSTDYDADDATTIFYKVQDFKNISLVRCELLTGRTHQIRVHAKYIKHNVMNDPVYGPSKKATKYGQYLVANEIDFIHPITNKKINVKIDMPKEFNEYIKKYGK